LPDTAVLGQLGAALAELREARGLSQADVVGRIELDEERRERAGQLRSAGDLDAIERGERDPSFLALVDIGRAIDVPVEEIFGVYGRRRGATR
jgi:transcriptional regulator with XRE-family HTH domain